MKLFPREAERYIASLGPKDRTALVFGDDRGAVREFAERIARAVVADLGDPFAVALLDAGELAGDPQRLGDEIGAMSLTGGRRLVWLREAGECQRALIESALETLAGQPSGGAFLVIEAGDLAYRSALRQLFENRRDGVALLCEAGQRGDVEALIREFLSQSKRNIAPDAFGALMARLGPDRVLARGALATLGDYLAASPPNAQITLDDIHAAIPDAGEAELDDIIDTLLDGARASLDAALARSLAAGGSAIGLIRIAQRSFQRVHWVLRQSESGHSIESAVARLRPPLPRHAQGTLAARCRNWTPRAVERALQRLIEAELQCKTTAVPEDAVCAQAFLAITGLKGR